jgi:hypothetical protein
MGSTMSNQIHVPTATHIRRRHAPALARKHTNTYSANTRARTTVTFLYTQIHLYTRTHSLQITVHRPARYTKLLYHNRDAYRIGIRPDMHTPPRQRPHILPTLSSPRCFVCFFANHNLHFGSSKNVFCKKNVISSS